jgi:hypothetical protein
VQGGFGLPQLNLAGSKINIEGDALQVDNLNIYAQAFNGAYVNGLAGGWNVGSFNPNGGVFTPYTSASQVGGVAPETGFVRSTRNLREVFAIQSYFNDDPTVEYYGKGYGFNSEAAMGAENLWCPSCPETTIQITANIEPYQSSTTSLNLVGRQIVLGLWPERNNITNERRELGMLVYVQSDQKFYTLIGSTANSSWQEFSGSSGTTGNTGRTGATGQTGPTGPSIVTAFGLATPPITLVVAPTVLHTTTLTLTNASYIWVSSTVEYKTEDTPFKLAFYITVDAETSATAYSSTSSFNQYTIIALQHRTGSMAAGAHTIRVYGSGPVGAATVTRCDVFAMGNML